MITGILDRYGTQIYRLNYQAETTTLSNLVNDLQSDPEVATALQTLNLVALVEELKTANNLFNENYLLRVKALSQAPDDSPVDLRKEATIRYRNLVEWMEAYIVINGPEPYEPLVKQVNELIAQYNEMIKIRKSKSDEDTNEEPGEES